MNQEVLIQLKKVTRATTDDYRNIIESGVRGLGYIVAGFLLAGQLAKETAEAVQSLFDVEQIVKPEPTLTLVPPVAVTPPVPVVKPPPTPPVIEDNEPVAVTTEPPKKRIHREVKGFAM